jgi:phage replication O-like protein O
MDTNGYTKTDNWLFDYVMPNAKPNTFKVVSAVCRLTSGWHRTEAELTFDDFAELTGIKNRGTLSTAVEDALEKGYIERVEAGRSFSYSLKTVPSDSPKIVLPDTSQSENRTDDQSKNRTKRQSENRTGDSPKIVPSTIYKEKKEKEKERRPSPTPSSEAFPFQNNGRNKEPTAADKRQQAIIKVCGLDESIPAHIRDAENTTAQLSNYTAEYITDRYNPGGWWYVNDWRGQKGQQPTPRAIIETIAKTVQTAVNGSVPSGPNLDEILSTAFSDV